MDNVSASVGIIAIVEGIKRYFPQISGPYAIILCAVVGAVAGYFGVNGLNVVSGVTAGLKASGAHQLVSAARE